jgi:hypothetical protein
MVEFRPFWPITSLCSRKWLTWRHWQGWDQAVSRPHTVEPNTWKQCWGAVQIYCGSGNEFIKVTAPVQFLVPDLDPEPDPVMRRYPIRKSRCTTGINDTSGKFCHQHNWCCWHRWQICHQCQRYRWTSVNDTSGLVSTTPVANNGNIIRLQTP